MTLAASPLWMRRRSLTKDVLKLSRRHLGRDTERGFSLIELMTVVIIIALLATMAIPSMLTAQRERRAFQGAADFAALFREARSRSAGTGVAVQVVITAIGGEATGVMREAPSRVATNSQTGGLASCTDTNWGALPPVAQTAIAGGVYQQDGVRANLFTNNTPVQTATMCFTPGGRVIIQTADNTGGNVPNGGVVSLLVERAPGGVPLGISRRVVMPQTGSPRIISD